MLSATYSVSDVKTTLRRTYSDYGFATELLYTAAVEEALRDIMMLMMYPVLGTATYTLIAAKDRVDLTTKETYLYWAEVYYACSDFLKKWDAVANDEDANASSENLEVEGYKYETTSSSSESGGSATNSRAVKAYYDKAISYMCIAGWNPHQLQIAGGPLGHDDDEDLYAYEDYE